MSLDPTLNPLSSPRPGFQASDARSSVSAADFASREDKVAARQSDSADDAKDKDRVAFADLLRASQARAHQAERQVRAAAKAARHDAAETSKAQEQDQAEAASQAQADLKSANNSQAPAETDHDAPVADDSTRNDSLAATNPQGLAASEAVPSSSASDSQNQSRAVSTIVAPQTPNASAPLLNLPAAGDDGGVDALAQALSDLKAALTGQVKSGDATKGSSDTNSADAAKPDAGQTDAQITQLMQALLSGKPLAPELKSLADDPKVAEALKAVRSALSALETTRGDGAKAVSAAFVQLASQAEAKDKAQTQGQTGDQPQPDQKTDAPFNAPVFTKSTTSPDIMGKTETPSVASQTAPADLSQVSAATPKAPDAPTGSDNGVMPAAPTASAQTGEALRLVRSEAALGSNLSSGALNNLTHMSAQIARHMSAKSTQFNMELHPADMGRVDVALSINHDGTLSAALRFDSPVAESQFRAQADELRRQLEAQGFQLSDSALSFSFRQTPDQSGGQGGQASDQTNVLADDSSGVSPEPARASQAFGALNETLDAAAPGAQLAQKLGLSLLGSQTYRLSLNVTA